MLPFYLMFRDARAARHLHRADHRQPGDRAPLRDLDDQGLHRRDPDRDRGSGAGRRRRPRARIIYDIVVPMARPGIITAAVFCFILTWNEFLFALILTRANAVTLAGRHARFRTGARRPVGADRGRRASSSPSRCSCFALVIQRHFVKGMTWARCGEAEHRMAEVRFKRRHQALGRLRRRPRRSTSRSWTGEFLVLLGPSGCGKTTTMRMIAGLEEPTEGEIRIGDARRQRPAAARARRGDGVPELRPLPAHDRRDNIGYPLKLRGVPKDGARGAGRAGGREGRARRPARPQAQGSFRAASASASALARALVRKPRVFLMDEPLSNLDAKLRVDDARRAEAPAPRARDHHRLRHARPDRGDDARHPRRRHEQGRHPPARARPRRSTTTPRTCSSPASSARRA